MSQAGPDGSGTAAHEAAWPRALGVPGLMLAGYGLLVLTGVLAHEAAWTGWTCLLLGGGLVALGARRLALPRATVAGKETSRRRLALTVLGSALVAATIVYNVATASGLSLPEWAIVVYGTAIVLSAQHLDRRLGPVRVSDAVGWSFAVVLAPLGLYALNAILSHDAAQTAAEPSVAALVVAPTAQTLRWLGTPVTLAGNSMALATPRGTLVLGVGLVCAGLYPMVLFGGLVGLHAWRDRVGARRIAVLLGAGLACLWAVNIARLAILARIGIAYGPAALEAAHANLGWILFALSMTGFWWVVHRTSAPSARPPQEPHV